jgi:anti-sigma factor RsiW
MLRCETAETLIAREVDGLLAGEEAVALDAHAEGCGACTARRRASQEVARALALRVDAPVLAGFAARVTARVFPGEPFGWVDAINWRRWTEWMLPVAAALLMVAIVAGNRESAVTTADTEVTASESTAAATDVWAWSSDADAATALAALSTEVSSEDVLATMLGTSAAGIEGKTNGR